MNEEVNADGLAALAGLMLLGIFGLLCHLGGYR